jgi:hypothetical protein
MHAWLGEGFRGRHVLVEGVPEMLDYFGYDTRPSGGGVCDVHFSCGQLDDGGRDGGEGAFEGGDEVCFAGDVAECICGVGDAEIYSVELVLWSRLWRKKGGTIHLIVHYHPGFRNHNLASK